MCSTLRWTRRSRFWSAMTWHRTPNKLLLVIPGSTQRASGQCRRSLAVIDTKLPIHDHVLNAIWILIGHLKRRAIDNCLRIEDSNVGKVALAQKTAFFKTNVGGWQSGHLMNGLQASNVGLKERGLLRQGYF